jgi:hypothetical protein
MRHYNADIISMVESCFSMVNEGFEMEDIHDVKGYDGKWW